MLSRKINRQKKDENNFVFESSNTEGKGRQFWGRESVLLPKRPMSLDIFPFEYNSILHRPTVRPHSVVTAAAGTVGTAGTETAA